MKQEMTNWITDRQLIFYLLLVIALFVTRIPLIGKYFRIVSTLVHEAAHAFTALVFNGEIIAVNLFSDTSGNTITKAKSRMVQFLVSFAGYPATALTGFVFLLMLSHGLELYLLFIILSLTLLMIVLYIRNGYGIFWASTFTIINLLLVYYNEPNSLYLATAFYSLIIFTDSVLSAFILLGITFRTPKKAGDSSNLQKITSLPAAFWSILFVCISLTGAWFSITRYFPSLQNLFN
jgi:hypothetical protein